MPAYMQSSRAYANLLTLLEGINGSSGGFYTDLGRRVYRRLIVPGDTRLVMPYMCAVLAGDEVAYEEDEGTALRVQWDVNLFMFCAEPANTEVKGISVERCLDLHDDVLRVWLPDQTLQGAAYTTKWSGGGRLTGMTELYAELQMRLRVVQWLALEGIGP